MWYAVHDQQNTRLFYEYSLCHSCLPPIDGASGLPVSSVGYPLLPTHPQPLRPTDRMLHACSAVGDYTVQYSLTLTRHTTPVRLDLLQASIDPPLS